MNKLKNYDFKRNFAVFLKKNNKYKNYILNYLYFVNLLLFLSFYITFKSSLFFILISSILNVATWVFMKDFVDDELDEEKQQISYFKKAKRNFTLNVFMFLNHFLLNIYNLLLNTLNQHNLNVKYKYSRFFFIFIFSIFLFFYIFLMNGEMTKKRIKKMLSLNFLEIFGLDVEDDLTEGDIYICSNSKTKLSVRLPYTDRFLHMLIIGPTGCGKTSQIITPMLIQDVKNLEAGVTVIEPKGDLAEKVYAMAQYFGRKAIYFNPQLEGCPSFNPLFGKEEDVIENIVTTFKMLDPDAKQYFQDMNEQLLRNALKILKRLKGNKATLIDLNTIVSNPAGAGRSIVNQFMKLPVKDESEAKENQDCGTYFIENYFAEKSKTYENCSGVRSQVSKITSNKFLRKVLNPETGSDLDFEKHLAEGGVLCITTAQGKLRDLGSFLGYFIILNFQSAVFKRPGNEDNRRPHFLYIDEFQKYSNPGFADMLTQGRSYRVASHLATQARAQIGMGSGKDGDAFINLVSTNCRNVVVFPGVSYDDAKYFSDQFGEELEIKDETGVSFSEYNPVHGFQPVGYDKITLKTKEELKARFTPTDIIYQKKKHIMFLQIKNMVVQPPISGVIDYIPMAVNKRLNKMISENEILMKKNVNPNECRDLTIEGAPLLPEWEEKIEYFKNEIELQEQKELDEIYGITSDSKNTVKKSIDDEFSKNNVNIKETDFDDKNLFEATLNNISISESGDNEEINPLTEIEIDSVIKPKTDTKIISPIDEDEDEI